VEKAAATAGSDEAILEVIIVMSVVEGCGLSRKGCRLKDRGEMAAESIVSILAV
jgi:hypothetical protein